MHLMLAEDVGGWIGDMLLIFAAMGTAALALVGIAPAIFGKRVLTLLLIAPAIFVGLYATYELRRRYIWVGVYDHDHFRYNFLEPWIPMAGIPLVTALVVVIVLFFRTRKRA